MHSGGFGTAQCIGKFAVIVSTVEFKSLLLGSSHCHWVWISCCYWSGHYCSNCPWSSYQPPFPYIEPLTLIWIPSPSLVSVNTLPWISSFSSLGDQCFLLHWCYAGHVHVAFTGSVHGCWPPCTGFGHCLRGGNPVTTVVSKSPSWVLRYRWW